MMIKILQNINLQEYQNIIIPIFLTIIGILTRKYELNNINKLLKFIKIKHITTLVKLQKYLNTNYKGDYEIINIEINNDNKIFITYKILTSGEIKIFNHNN